MLWGFCLILWPLVLWLSHEYYFLNMEGHLTDIILFAIFMCVVSLFPIIINNQPVFFVNGISIVVFLSFGLFVEIILTQIAVLLVLKVDKKELYRIPLNMIMFLAVSVTSAAVFWLLGGNHQTFDYRDSTDIIAVFGYAISTFIVNQSIIKLFRRFLFKQKMRFFDKGLVWELTSSLLVIPVGLVLAVLYTEIGMAAIFYMGIPIVSISVILRLLYSYQQINRYLERTGQIGHQLTKRLEIEEVYDVFIQELGNLIQVDYAYIYVTNNNEYLKLERLYDGNKKVNITADYERVDRDEVFSGKVWSIERPITFGKAKEWSTINNEKIPLHIESVLSLPVEYDNDVIGVVTLVSKQKKAFEKYHFRILDILTNYLGVAIENAKNYEETKSKSERDSLTGLYNYRYLENQMEHYYQVLPLDQSEIASLIILDIDHFKTINDSYGHESGNEILCQIANRLTELFYEHAIIARYGGEEFVVFLPETDLTEAVQLAESLRVNIASIPFILREHILDYNNSTEVSITASLGVATYPLHCESHSELIRHADRAMYIGAKRKGRNKVAVYEELQTL